MPARNDALRGLVRQWIAKAEEDLAVARQLLRENTLFASTVCFHAQQAAEKWLKAVLTQTQAPFPKTHDLAILLDLLAAASPDVTHILTDAVTLSAYGVECRYPAELPPLTAGDARRAVELAEHEGMSFVPC